MDASRLQIVAEVAAHEAEHIDATIKRAVARRDNLERGWGVRRVEAQREVERLYRVKHAIERVGTTPVKFAQQIREHAAAAWTDSGLLRLFEGEGEGGE